MMPQDNAGDAFLVPDFHDAECLETGKSDDEDHDHLFNIKKFDFSLTALDKLYNFTGGYLHLPPLDDLHLDPQSPLEEPPDLSISDGELPPIPDLDDPTQPHEDIWQVAEDMGPLSSETKLLSWEAFARPRDNRTHGPAYISDAGSAAFDAALQRVSRLSGAVDAGKPLQSEALLRCLCQLGLGRGSILFRFDNDKNVFRQVLESGRASGCTVECFRSFIEPFLECGAAVRRLQNFVEATRVHQDSLPAKIALASAIEAILGAVDGYLAGSQAAIRSLIQLQRAHEPVQRLVGLAEVVVQRTKAAFTDDETMEHMFAILQDMDDEGTDTLDVCKHIFKRVAWHWLRKVEGWIGLTSASTALMGCFDYARRSGVDGDEDSAPLALPTFLPDKDINLVIESKQCLEYMKEHHEDHPILKVALDGAGRPILDWHFRLEDVERLQVKAEKYQTDVLQAIKTYSDDIPNAQTIITSSAADSSSMQESPFDSISRSIGDLDTEVEAPTAYSATSVHSNPALPDELFEAIRTFLCGSAYGELLSTTQDGRTLLLEPPISLSPSLSLQSLLRTQHHLLSYATLHSLLHRHWLLDHLCLHHTFSLFGSGLFVSRLRTVLFSSDTEAVERQTGVHRTGGAGTTNGMGLKLGTGSRNQWPPASSEVRLALMGVLGESWREETAMSTARSRPATPASGSLSSHHHTFDHNSSDATLPGDLSFTIRTDLPPETITRILDANSLHALDFLQLSYTPPRALAPLFSARVLDHYDRIFTLQLRLLRVTAALSSIHYHVRILCSKTSSTGGTCEKATKTILAIRHAAQTLTTSLLSHFRHAGIAGPWRLFLSRLHAAANACKDPCPPALNLLSDGQGGDASTNAAATNPTTLSTLHETTLQRILSGLLLRKKHRPAMEALEGVFEVILEFERVLRAHVDGHGTIGGALDSERESGEELRRLLEAFGEKKGAFVRACEGVVLGGESKSGGRGGAEVDEGGIGAVREILELLRWKSVDL